MYPAIIMMKVSEYGCGKAFSFNDYTAFYCPLQVATNYIVLISWVFIIPFPELNYIENINCFVEKTNNTIKLNLL